MFRTDEFATLYMFDPLRRLFGGGRGVPVLMYHSISDAPEHKAHPYYQTVTTPAAFARQMAWLHRNGYSTMDSSEVANAAATAGRERRVAITFDDGFRDFYQYAYPILSEYDFKATMYLPTAYIGETAGTFKEQECLTWNEIRELHRNRIEFGSHTVTHPQLASLGPDAVRYEVDASKKMIEDRLGYPVRSFAYPYAFPEADRTFTARLRGFLQEAGYDNGVCTTIGTVQRTGDRFFMKRLPVNSCDNDSLFEAKLAGSYDWLHSVQYISKRLATSKARASWRKPRIA